MAHVSEVSVIDLVPFGHAGEDNRFFALRLSNPGWNACQAGQFVMIRPKNWGLDMPLARPFSICRATSKDLVLFFQITGKGTQRMAELTAGDVLDIWGPLGSSFALEESTSTLLIAGGIGIAPFIHYAQNHPKPWNVQLEFGHRFPLGCYPFDSINEKLEAENHLEIDEQDREVFLQHIEKRIIEYSKEKGLVLACGPTPLLRYIQKTCEQHAVRCQLSLENRMACGVGACLGCVVSDAKREFPVQSCTKGPVFWGHDITLDDSI